MVKPSLKKVKVSFRNNVLFLPTKGSDLCLSIKIKRKSKSSYCNLMLNQNSTPTCSLAKAVATNIRLE